jgi:DNA-binding MarR family transcriptional regulator
MVRGYEGVSDPGPGDAVTDAMTDATADAVLLASKRLFAVSAESIALTDESITLPQFRVLVLLSSRGSMNLSALLEHLGMHSSSGSRTIDLLVGRGLVDRQCHGVSGGEVVIGLTLDGAAVVGKATQWRRREIAKIVARMPESTRESLLAIVEQFNDAGGEPPATADVLAGVDWL